jgi:hypothetical protein
MLEKYFFGVLLFPLLCFDYLFELALSVLLMN